MKFPTQEQLKPAFDALYLAIKEAYEKANAETPTPEEPKPEEPKQVSAIVTVTKNTGGEWINGVSKQSPRILIASSPEALAAAVVGATATFSDGSKRKVTKVATDAKNIYPSFDGKDLLDPVKVGHPNTVTFTADATAGDTTEPGKTEPTPEPTKPTPGKPGQQRARGEMGSAMGMGMGQPGVVPGELGYTYELPVTGDVDRALTYGLSLARLGSLRERLIQPGLKHQLYLGEHKSPRDNKMKSYSLPKILEWLRYCNSQGTRVMLDLMHNYGGLSEGNNASNSSKNPQHKKIGTSGGPSYDVFANDWKAIIEYIQTDAKAWDAVYGIDIMNEWVGLPSDNVYLATQKFLDVCAPIMGEKLAIIEGDKYSNTPNFWKNNSRFPELKDPRGPGFIEMSAHLYVDQDMSGMYETGDTYNKNEVSSILDVFTHRITPFLDGCDKYGFKASIGEWIVPGDHPNLLEASKRGIEYALDRGCNVIVFGMGKGYASNAHHNLEIARNKPTLEVVKGLAAYAKR